MFENTVICISFYTCLLLSSVHIYCYCYCFAPIIVFLFLIGRSCPLITAPSNGQMTCSGEQLTGQNCTFWCDPGYTMTGSAIRSCLGSNQSWSGEESKCLKSQCPMLTSTGHRLVLYPCTNEYQDYCRSLCETGYTTGSSDTIWTQTCNVTTELSSEVDWYPQLTCTGNIKWSLLCGKGCHCTCSIKILFLIHRARYV